MFSNKSNVKFDHHLFSEKYSSKKYVTIAMKSFQYIPSSYMVLYANGEQMA